MSQKTKDTEVESIIKNITYSKDMKTGLCYGIVTIVKSSDIFDSGLITCVPCDSLKKVKVIEVN
jgi:hypothetical protein